MAIYEALLAWLRRRESKSGWAFLDRPFVLTIMGGIAAGLLTTCWQTSERRREVDSTYERAIVGEQLALMKELGAAVEHTGGILNSWFFKVTWIAEEANKPKSAETDKNIAEWKKQIDDLQLRHTSAASVENILLRVGVLYKCPRVKSAAAQMLSSWGDFENAFVAFNADWNEKQKLPEAEIKLANDKRNKLLADIKSINVQLTRNMADEVSAARGSIATCPP